MPLSKDKNGWGIYSLRKVIEYVTMGLALWQFGMPALNNYIEQRIEAYDTENHKTPLRTLLAEETGIPADRIHIVIGQWYKESKEHDEVIEEIWPLLEEEMNSIIPKLVITDGNEFWVASDGEYYRVHRAEDGRGSYFSQGKWHYIYW